jgi:serine/threonine protein kinase/tetratricopeptide (TPR) repeat protein
MTVGLAEGTLFAHRFEVERLVAIGGMGTVYCARDRTSGERVALKILGGGGGQHHETERFLREARILSEMRHPSIVSYVVHGKANDGQLYLVMQWLEGEDLAARLKRGPLSLHDSLILMKRVAAALAAAHERGIIHRDLKPSNLFLRDGRVQQAVVLDFGVARAIDTATALTSTGVLVGTPNYMAPEQARGSRHIHAAADIFSLGCVLYECLTGRPPFQAEHTAAVLSKILFDEPAPVRGVRPVVPEPWDALLSRMLKKDPSERPRDAAALEADLAALPEAFTDNTTVLGESPWSSDALWTGSEQELVSVVLASSEEPLVTGSGAAADDATEPHISTARRALVRFGVDVEQLADRSLIVSVASKGSAKDQAVLAARAALLLRARMPRARIAVTTGRGVRTQRMPVGEAVDRAVKLLQGPSNGGPSSVPSEKIWLDEVTANLLDSRFVLAPAPGGAILEGERATADNSRLLLGKPTPCVGRERELEQLAGLLGRCAEDSEAQAVLVTAPPGGGKSRLRHEFLRRHSAAPTALRVLLGQGDPLSAGSPYGILGEALRRSAAIHHGDELAHQRASIVEILCRDVGLADKQRVSEFLGELCGIPFSGEDSPPLQAARSDPRAMSEQIEQAFVDWLRAECAPRVVLLVLEDLHWGDTLTVKLVDAALRALAEQRLFVLALARPEVAERFPNLWQRCLQTIALRPLSPKASERLVREVLGERPIGAAALARMVAQAAGNPLFLEELIRSAAEEGSGERSETVLAILQARLRRLDPESRRVLRAASIFGNTFWASGLQLLCERGGAHRKVADCLHSLVHAEIIEEHRSSQFPQEPEYGFRHALVRDAAYSLLTEADRAEGHRLACTYLERMGETDAMALAEHAEHGGDMERAVAFFCRAAELSREKNDLEQALARAGRGVACGAKDEQLGVLRAIQSLASFGTGEWIRAAETGAEALALLPRGSLWWCKIAEPLFNVFPLIGQLDRFQRLVHDFAETEPAPEATPAYVCADSYQLMMFSVLGSRDGCRGCLERIHRFGAAALQRDTHASATFNVYHGWFVYTLEPDPYLALSLGEESVRGFMQTRDPRGRALAKSLVGISAAALGGFTEGEESLRESLARGEELRDAFLTVNAQSYLIVVLTESEDPTRLAEVEAMARSVRDANLNVGYVAIAHMSLGLASLARGDAAQAEVELRRSLELFAVVPPYSLMGRRAFIRFLGAQGRTREAAEAAQEGLDVLKKLGGAGWTEVPFRVAAAEALRAAGSIDAGRGALKEALQQIELRASRITDPVWRERYLTQRPENVRALELAREWLQES